MCTCKCAQRVALLCCRCLFAVLLTTGDISHKYVRTLDVSNTWRLYKKRIPGLEAKKETTQKNTHVISRFRASHHRCVDNDQGLYRPLPPSPASEAPPKPICKQRHTIYEKCIAKMYALTSKRSQHWGLSPNQGVYHQKQDASNSNS